MTERKSYKIEAETKTVGSSLQLRDRSGHLLRGHLLPALFGFRIDCCWIGHFLVEFSGDVSIDARVLLSRELAGLPVRL